MSAETTETAAEQWPPPIKYQRWESPENVEDIIAEPAVNDLGEYWQTWPILVEITEKRIIWADGPTREKAIESFNHDGEWYERPGIQDTAFDYDVQAREPYDWEMRDGAWRDIVRREVYGPLREDGKL